MPDRRKHRGPHPEDQQLFAPEERSRLRSAVADCCWLFSRGYARDSTLRLVGDRYALQTRQRTAVARCACADVDISSRRSRRINEMQLASRELWIDGYNVLTSLEAALAGGVILAAQDGAYRDLASMHGNYRKVAETGAAIELVGQYLASHSCGPALWLLDRPVSNSARLQQQLIQIGHRYGWDWNAELVPNPDTNLIATHGVVVASADSHVLDHAACWLNLARHVIDTYVAGAWIVDLSS